MKKRKGEIITLLTVGAVVVIGLTAVVSSFFVNQKKTTQSKAAEVAVCESGSKTSFSCAGRSVNECVYDELQAHDSYSGNDKSYGKYLTCCADGFWHVSATKPTSCGGTSTASDTSTTTQPAPVSSGACGGIKTGYGSCTGAGACVYRTYAAVDPHYFNQWIYCCNADKFWYAKDTNSQDPAKGWQTQAECVSAGGPVAAAVSTAPAVSAAPLVPITTTDTCRWDIITHQCSGTCDATGGTCAGNISGCQCSGACTSANKQMCKMLCDNTSTKTYHSSGSSNYDDQCFPIQGDIKTYCGCPDTTNKPFAVTVKLEGDRSNVNQVDLQYQLGEKFLQKTIKSTIDSDTFTLQGDFNTDSGVDVNTDCKVVATMKDSTKLQSSTFKCISTNSTATINLASAGGTDEIVSISGTIKLVGTGVNYISIGQTLKSDGKYGMATDNVAAKDGAKWEWKGAIKGKTYLIIARMWKSTKTWDSFESQPVEVTAPQTDVVLTVNNNESSSACSTWAEPGGNFNYLKCTSYCDSKGYGGGNDKGYYQNITNKGIYFSDSCENMAEGSIMNYCGCNTYKKRTVSFVNECQNTTLTFTNWCPWGESRCVSLNNVKVGPGQTSPEIDVTANGTVGCSNIVDLHYNGQTLNDVIYYVHGIDCTAAASKTVVNIGGGIPGILAVCVN